jgi:glycosyltransferase involved in cell wall biosynthesis
MNIPMDTSAINCANDSSARTAPAVSVIIPAYNTAIYISEALDSVFAQTVKDFEVIVINDGSPETETLELALRPYRGRIVYLTQENRGPSAARNLGIRHARGEYIAFLDSDDSWLPEYLAVQMKLFKETSSLDMVYCDCLLCGDSPFAGKRYMDVLPPTGPATFENLLLNETSIQTSCVVVRRQVVIDTGLFDESLMRNEDFDLWLRLAYRGAKIARQDRVLSRYRKRPEGLSWDGWKLYAAKIDVLKRFEGSSPLPSETRTLLRASLARAEADLALRQGKLCLFAGDFGGAWVSLSRVNALFPRNKLRLALLGLRVAPRLTAFAATAWDRCLVGIKHLVATQI